MCNFGNGGFYGGNMCWIIILLLLFCSCGNSGYSGDRDGGCGCC